MCSGQESVVASFDALQLAVSRLQELSFDALTTPERMALLERCEIVRRQLPSIEHALINQIAEQSSEEQLGGRLPSALASRLRITRAEASRRVGEAAELGERRAMTGEPVAPQLSATAAAQRAGHLGEAHVRVIRDFVRHLPVEVDIETLEKAEAHLARLATRFRPDQLAKLAQRLMDCLNPDGTFTDEDRARRRGLTLGKQGLDGMSRLTGWLTPEARAGLDAVLAKLAAPGMCNPQDESPVVDGPPPQDVAQRDTRSESQRTHDGLNAALRGLLASGNLGQHNGLPASIIVSTTLKELESASGKALTGGGTLLPMSDVIRLGRHANHYLAIFDDGKALALYHTKRLASPGQRIVLYTKDRGCSAPGCDVPGYRCEVHHVREWASTHRTDIDDLTFACGPHHKLLDKGWSPEKTATAAPNGFRHHTWTRGSRGPMAFNIPRSCSPTMPTTGSRVGGPQSAWRPAGCSRPRPSGASTCGYRLVGRSGSVSCEQGSEYAGGDGDRGGLAEDDTTKFGMAVEMCLRVLRGGVEGNRLACSLGQSSAAIGSADHYDGGGRLPYPVATVASNLYPLLADGIGGVDDAVASVHQRDTQRVDGAHRCDRRAPGQMDGMRCRPA